MKKIYLLLAIIPLVFTSCDIRPDAFFYVDNNVVYTGEEVWFTNETYNAVEYEWDFDDGTYSSAVNPIHTFNATGEYEVILTAFNRKGTTDQYSEIITVIAPTQLLVQVRDIDYPADGIANARVRLYPTLTDWDYESNLVAQGYTDSNGNIIFEGLDPYVYYVDVFENEFDNWALGAADAAYIRTPQLVENSITTFTAYVEYVAGGKAVGEKRDRKEIISSIERKKE